jgi:NRPS condensation-like uncharacterized protein
MSERASTPGLDLNWMDRALIAQTYAGRPMTTHHVVDVEAPFDRARLSDALAALIGSVPALRSFVRESPLRVARFAAPAPWTSLDQLITWSDVEVDLGASGWLLRGFDLSSEEPLRVLHSPRRDGGYQLVFTLHHSVTDGVGAVALLDALLARYRALDGERASIPAPFAPSGVGFLQMLSQRGARLTASLLGANLRSAGRFGDRRAALLERVEARAEAMHCAVVDLDATQWSRLHDRAVSLGVTRNDLLLTAFLRAAASWRRAEGMPEEAFRALVPVDLRSEFGVGRSLQNHLGVIEADFTAAEVDDASLLSRVSERLRAGRAPERALATPVALALMGTLLPPFACREFFRWLDQRPSSFMYSFLFSQIRLPEGLRFPASVRARRVYCLSGLPRQPGIGLTVTASSDGVTAALAYEVPRLSDDGARRLMQQLLVALGEA